MVDKKGGKKEASPDDIMTPADMKPILARAKRGDPASCVICLTKDKDGVILLDKKRKPKQLMGELKKQAADAGLILDTGSMRFGQAVVDTDADPGLVTFKVNKDASGAMRPKLLERMKKAGFTKVEITVDTGLEAEEDVSEDQQAPEASAPAQARPVGDAAAAPSAAQTPEPAQAAAPAAAAEAPAAEAAGVAPELVRQLADLMKRIPEVAAQAPAQKDTLIKLATEAAAAVKAGDPGKAGDAVEALAAATKAAAAQGANGGGAAKGANGTAATAATISKTSLAWTATRKAVEKQISTLQGKMAEAYKDHGFGADLDKFFKSKVTPVLEKLDESLVDVLAEAGKTTEAAEQRELMGKAQKIVSQYEGYLASEPLIKQLDNNPFMELRIEETLTKTLSTLNKSLTSIAGSLRV